MRRFLASDGTMTLRTLQDVSLECALVSKRIGTPQAPPPQISPPLAELQCARSILTRACTRRQRLQIGCGPPSERQLGSQLEVRQPQPPALRWHLEREQQQAARRGVATVTATTGNNKPEVKPQAPKPDTLPVSVHTSRLNYSTIRGSLSHRHASLPVVSSFASAGAWRRTQSVDGARPCQWQDGRSCIVNRRLVRTGLGRCVHSKKPAHLRISRRAMTYTLQPTRRTPRPCPSARTSFTRLSVPAASS